MVSIDAAALARGRAWAEARMGAVNGGSDARVWRKSGLTARDQVSLREHQGFDQVGTDLVPVRVAGTAANSAPYRTLQPGVSQEQAARVIHFSAAFSDLCDGDVVELVAGQGAGTFWSLVDITWQDQATARRIPAVQIDPPGGLNPLPS
jgi:hypothetical protein